MWASSTAATDGSPVRCWSCWPGEGDLCIGDNEPYSVDDESDYTIPTHGERRGIPHVLIEIRQDLIATAPGQSGWAARLSELLGRACDRLVEAGVT